MLFRSQTQARVGFQRFTADEKQGSVKPDIIALVDASGNLLAMNEVPTLLMIGIILLAVLKPF